MSDMTWEKELHVIGFKGSFQVQQKYAVQFSVIFGLWFSLQ
jgi:hypothetical protein